MKTRLPLPYRQVVWVVLLFLLAPIHFIHLLPQFSTHLVGDVMDTAEYPWNEWWTAHALRDLIINPFQHDYMFYPLGIHEVHHTYTFLDGLFFTFFRPLVPLLVYHNAVTWASIFLNSLAAYTLVFRLTGLSGLAFIGALAFAHSPILTSYQGAQSLIEAYLFVFFVLASYRLFETRRYTRGILAGVLLGLAVYNYPYYFVMGLVWFGLLVLYRLFPWSVNPGGENGRPVAGGVGRFLPWVIFFLLFSLTLIPREIWEVLKLSSRLRTVWGVVFLVGIYYLPKAKEAFFDRRLADFSDPTQRKRAKEAIRSRSFREKWVLPQSIHWTPPSWKEAASVLALSALVLGAAAMTAFPYTQSYLTDPATRSAVKSKPLDFVIYSVDLTGFFAPFHPWLSGVYKWMAMEWGPGGLGINTPGFLGYCWLFLLVAGCSLFFRRPGLRLWIIGWACFLFFSLGPYLKIHGIVHVSFFLPGILLPELPLLESTRTLSRFLVPTVLFTIVIGCLRLKEVLVKASHHRTLLYAGIFLVTAFEFALIPRPYQVPRTDYRVPAVYCALADQTKGKAGVLLDLPLFTHSGDRSEGRGETRTFFYQTVHQQRLVGGISSKLDDRVFTFFSQLPGIQALWSRRPITREELAGLLYALDVDWIVLRKRDYDQDSLAAYRNIIGPSPYITPFYEDPDYWGWRVERESAALEKEALAYWSVPGVLQRLIYPPPITEKNRAVEMIIPPRLFSRIRLQFPPEALENLKAIKMNFRDYRMVEVSLTELAAFTGTTLIPKNLLAPSKNSNRPVKLVVIPEVRSSAKKLPAFQFQLTLKP
jgi:hypothetical protein